MSDLSPDLLRGVACAALDPNLRRLLLFDADFATLKRATITLAEMLRYHTQGVVKQVVLPSTARDEALWGQMAPVGEQGAGRLSLAWQPGLLTQAVDEADILLVIIPDLTLLNLTVARTCITLMDTPIAHLQRHGQDRQWQPRLCWIAGCPTAQVGRVTHHLLDRFALRLPVARSNHTTIASIEAWLEGDAMLSPIIPPDLLSHIQTQPTSLPALSPEGMARLLAYFPAEQGTGIRRELALARLSRVLAYIDGQTIVGEQDVYKAAQLIHLPEPDDASPIKLDDPKPDMTPPQQERSAKTDPLPENPTHQPSGIEPEQTPAPTPLPESDPIQTAPQSVDSVSLTPYPEDEATIERDVFPLQMPMRRHQVAVVTQGAVLGVQTAQSLTDLAFVPTLVEALPYQQIRQKRRQVSANKLIILPNDLRCYRRVPPSEYMLLLLLDYTCLEGCQWQEALLPHLRWAYVSRATVVLIQVGQAEPDHELRARRIMAKTVLTPLLLQALEAKSGRTTPLAHGLEIAYQTVMQSQQHGRSTLKQTRFVLITDGRGNVPLKVSQTGVEQRPVRREGIEDALTIAYSFRGMKRVIPILLDPQPEYHVELPIELAEALGAIHEQIPLKEWEVTRS